MSRSLVRSLCAAAVLALIPLGAGHAQQKTSLVFSAGPTGGSWTPMAAATAEVIKKKYPELDVLVEPGAALVNMEKMRNDKTDLGWSMTTVVSDARAGAESWKGKQTDKPMFVANYYPNVWQLVVAGLGRHPQARRPQGQGGGAAAARATPASPRDGSCCCKVRHEARRPRHQELRLHHRERRGHPQPAGGGDGLVHHRARLVHARPRHVVEAPHGQVPEDDIEKMRQINPGLRPPRHPQGHLRRIRHRRGRGDHPGARPSSSRTPRRRPTSCTRSPRRSSRAARTSARVTAAMKGVTAKDMAQNHGCRCTRGGEVLPRSRPPEVTAARAQAHRLRGAGRRRGGGRHVPLPRLRPAHPRRARQPRPPDHRARLLPGAGLPALPVHDVGPARRGRAPGCGRDDAARAHHDPLDRPRARRPLPRRASAYFFIVYDYITKRFPTAHPLSCARHRGGHRRSCSWCSRPPGARSGSPCPSWPRSSSPTRWAGPWLPGPAPAQGPHLRDPHRPDLLHHRGALRHPAGRRRLLRHPLHHLRRLPREVGARASSS